MTDHRESPEFVSALDYQELVLEKLCELVRGDSVIMGRINKAWGCFTHSDFLAAELANTLQEAVRQQLNQVIARRRTNEVGSSNEAAAMKEPSERSLARAREWLRADDSGGSPAMRSEHCYHRVALLLDEVADSARRDAMKEAAVFCESGDIDYHEGKWRVSPTAFNREMFAHAIRALAEARTPNEEGAVT